MDKDISARCTPWKNVDVAGSLLADERFRPQDDFHAAINAQWLAVAQVRPGETSESAFRERMREVQAQIEELLREGGASDAPDGSGASGHEERLVHRLYRDFLDMGTRDERGVAPILPLVRRISALSSLDELTAFLSSDASVVATSFVTTESFADKKDSANYVVYLDHDVLSLTDANEYRTRTAQGERIKQADDTYFRALLERVGFLPEEACRIAEEMFFVEEQIGAACLGADAPARDDFEEITYNPMTFDELRAASPRFPIAAILDAQGLAGSKRFILGEPSWLATMDRVYVPENLGGFKALLLWRALTRYGSFLDQACYDLAEAWNSAKMGSVGAMPLSKKAYDLTNALLGMAVGHLYVDRHLTDATKHAIEGLIDQVVATYRTRLSTTDWLSPGTRARAVEKLDAMTVRVGRPTSWPPYENLRFEDEGTLVDELVAIRRFEFGRASAKVNKPVDREEWLMEPQAVNAYYLPTDNSINILAGILGGVFYDPEGSREGWMGGIGMVIGHEITHAFDRTGSLYDKDGNLGESWWTDDDRAAFKQRTDAVAAYWDTLEVLPGRYVNGKLCAGEITADLGGMTCMASIAHGVEGFDWEAMFTAFARNWRTQESGELVEFLLVNDVHAPSHLRTNATVQQLPEFYETFGVEPGDGMYLAPERRLSVW